MTEWPPTNPWQAMGEVAATLSHTLVQREGAVVIEVHGFDRSWDELSSADEPETFERWVVRE